MNDNIIPGLLLISLVVTVVVTFITFYLSRENEKAISRRINSAEEKFGQVSSDMPAEKAKYAWDLARVTLEAYFARNLSQITWIFWLSVLVMMAGFGVIIWGISRSIEKPDVLAPAVIATLAGLITEFIGATFLFIYRSTIQQAMDYSKTLERINSVGMAVQLLETLPPEESNKVRAKIAEVLMQQAYKVSPDSVETESAG